MTIAQVTPIEKPTTVSMSVPDGICVPWALMARSTESWLTKTAVLMIELIAESTKRAAVIICIGRVHGVGSR